MIITKCVLQCGKAVVGSLAAVSTAPLITPTASAVASTLCSSTSSICPSLATAIFSLSGGATTKSVIDVSRFKFRLEGLHAYAVITTLLMNASLRLYSSTPKKFTSQEHVRNVMKVLFSLMVAISIMTGSYTTIVFSLIELYSKRALGRSQDAAVLEFFTQVQPIREQAYDTWLLSLVSFQASFVLSLFLNHDRGFDWKIATFAAVAGILCWWKWSTVMALAAALLQFGTDM